MILQFHRITALHWHLHSNTLHTPAIPVARNTDEIAFYIQKQNYNLWPNRMKHHTLYSAIRIHFYVCVQLFLFKHLSELYVDAFVRNIHQQMLVCVMQRDTLNC